MDWYKVLFDDKKITQKVDPPGRDGWTQELLWEDILRVCFEQGGFLESDTIYIFTGKREESYVIPMDADGGLELWHAIIDRGLFDAKLAIEAATGEGGFYCWPEITEEEVRQASEQEEEEDTN